MTRSVPSAAADGPVPDRQARLRRAADLIAQMPRGLRLGFEKTLEHAFQRWHSQQHAPIVRLALGIAVAAYTAFLILDALTWRRYAEGWVHEIIFGLSTSASLALILAAWGHRWIPWLPRVARIAVLGNVLPLTVLSGLGPHMGIYLPSQVLILQEFYILLFSGLLVRESVPLALLALTLFVNAAAVAGDTVEGVTVQALFLVATVLLGTGAAFLGERRERQVWLQGQMLEDLADHDGLTGLYNRRAFFERAESRLRQGRRDSQAVALLMLDLDHFKQINDERGHHAGDECLRRLGAVLARASRRPLDLAARIGGEEFILLLYGISREWAEARAEQIRAEVEALRVQVPPAQGLNFTVSIGIAFHAAGARTELQKLISQADVAMYSAKRQGRNTVCVAA